MNESEDELQALFEGMQPRTAPPEAARQKAYAAASTVFDALKRRRRRRLGAGIALAASVVLAWFIAGMQVLPARPFVVELADAPQLRVNGQPVSGVRRALEVTAGLRMEASEPARLSLGQATDLRLNAHTTIVWLDRARLELVDGAIYVDTGDQDDMTVVTDRGTIRDVGTQFLVSFQADSLEVAVRSGMTQLDTRQGRFVAKVSGSRGDVLRVSADRVSSSAEPTSDARWQWIHQVPRGYESDRVAELLEEIATDMGLQVDYEDMGTRAWVLNQQLKGERLTMLDPDQALEVLSAATGLNIRRTENGLSIAQR